MEHAAHSTSSVNPVHRTPAIAWSPNHPSLSCHIWGSWTTAPSVHPVIPAGDITGICSGLSPAEHWVGDGFGRRLCRRQCSVRCCVRSGNSLTRPGGGWQRNKPTRHCFPLRAQPDQDRGSSQPIRTLTNQEASWDSFLSARSLCFNHTFVPYLRWDPGRGGRWPQSQRGLCSQQDLLHKVVVTIKWDNVYKAPVSLVPGAW